MHLNNTFEEIIPKVNEATFEGVALDLFQYQAGHNRVYKLYLENLGVNIKSVTRISQIPFLPIEFYKNQKVMTGEWKPEALFKSSGTTDVIRSTNYVRSLEFYHRISRNIFEGRYGRLEDHVIIALLPSYLEQGDSSLIAMVDYFIKSTGDKRSTYTSLDCDEIKNRIDQVREKKIVLIGVAYALLDLAEKAELDHDQLMVIETGGMKGRKKEMVRDELHDILQGSFNVEQIFSEYGMTELCSQAYGASGNLICPPWMKVMVREVEDPFHYFNGTRTGAINIIDLANIDTCAFLETKDLGRLNSDGSFQVLGRMDNSDIRGCNLMMA